MAATAGPGDGAAAADAELDAGAAADEYVTTASSCPVFLCTEKGASHRVRHGAPAYIRA